MPDAAVPPVASLFDLSGRVVVVTGASGGIGAGIAVRLAEAGASVVVHFRRDEAGARRVAGMVADAGGRAEVCAADLTRPEEAARLLSAAAEAFSEPDILINNAGAYPVAAIVEMTEDEWTSVIDANLKSVHLATQALARRLVAAGRGGAIVNIASIEASNVAALHGHYVAAKAGVVMYTRAAARELGPAGIRVNAVSPGLIWREGLDQTWPDGVRRYSAAVPLGRLGLPADVADACLFLASPAARWITGAELVVDGGVLTNTAY